ncbi:MAG: glycosyltransferase family 2 protein [Cyanobium sp.]
MNASLPPQLQSWIRGDWAGHFDGFGADGALEGWACAVPVDAETGPLTVELWVEDLLVPGSAQQVACLTADQNRPDLLPDEPCPPCGFALRGPLGLLPPGRSAGTVLRALVRRADRLLDLPGSPMRLDPDRYQLFLALCGRGPRSPLGLLPLEGPWIHGWAPPGTEAELWLDGSLLERLCATAEGRLLQPLPGSACDGRLHHLELRSPDGKSQAERLEFTPFQLISWPALLEHAQPPLPYGFEPMGRERHRCLAIALEMAESGIRPLPTDLPRLQRLLYGPLDIPPFEPPLQLPTSDTPRVSVIIPVHGRLPVTRRCLAALCYAPTAIPFEVVLVDDGCPERSAERLAGEVRGLRCVRHEEGRGFNQACHSGVAAALAPFVVLLNNDTEPCARWLDELLDPFERWADTGLSGAQLVYPDGRLQEAGGIVWGNGEPWNYGRGGNPYAPEVAYARQVDYLSAAAVAIRRELWDRIGGFSPEFAPAYYEDTDLAFKVRAAGHSVRYAPLARVIHHEGLSCGTDPGTETGLKRFQNEHAPLFRQKWAGAFLPSGSPSFAEAELVKDRGILGRALFLDHAPPRPDRDAGSHAALVEMDLVQRLGWKVTFLPANLAWLGGYSEELQRRGIESIHAPFHLSGERFLRERGGEFDLIPSPATRRSAITWRPSARVHRGPDCCSAMRTSTTFERSASCGPRSCRAMPSASPARPWKRHGAMSFR